MRSGLCSGEGELCFSGAFQLQAGALVLEWRRGEVSSEEGVSCVSQGLLHCSIAVRHFSARVSTDTDVLPPACPLLSGCEQQEPHVRDVRAEAGGLRGSLR